MTLNELVPKGTYAAVRVLDPANTLISAFISKAGLSTSYEIERRKHVTLLYSRVWLPNFVPDPSIVHLARCVGFDLFDFKDGEKCLVMKLSAPTLSARFAKLMSEHPATYDFPTYQPHITLAYKIPADFDIGKLPSFSEDIQLGLEYSEDLIT